MTRRRCPSPRRVAPGGESGSTATTVTWHGARGDQGRLQPIARIAFEALVSFHQEVSRFAHTPAHRIVYAGCGFAGKSTSLLSALARAQQVVDPTVVLSGEHRFRLTRSSGESVVLDLSISHSRAIHADYDPTSSACSPKIREEIDRLASATGVIFVIDSQAERDESNVYQFEKLIRDVATRGVEARSKPIVFQVNKRDVPDARTMAWVRETFRAERAAYVESVAIESVGTLEALREVLKLANAIA